MAMIRWWRGKNLTKYHRSLLNEIRGNRTVRGSIYERNLDTPFVKSFSASSVGLDLSLQRSSTSSLRLDSTLSIGVIFGNRCAFALPCLLVLENTG